MYIIGISAHYHDSSVCLFKDGLLVYACEEEKFTGIKHDSTFPYNSLTYAIKRYKITNEQIETICYYEDPKLKLQRVKNNIKKLSLKNLLFSIKSYLTAKSNIKKIDDELRKYSNNVFYSTHHESHHYYSYYSSKFKDSLSLSVDGVGEIDTVSFAVPGHKGLNYYSLGEYPHSLGLYYSAMTSFLGFRPNEGEYKVMGLASYGTPDKFIDKVRKLITYNNSNLQCNLDVFVWNKSNKIMFNEKLSELLGIEQRLPEEQLDQTHMDLASAVQKRYEEILFEILKTLSLFNTQTNLCLSGGCAYNGTANGKIIDETNFKHLWIPPAPSDAGSSIGACVHYLVTVKNRIPKIPNNPFIGPMYGYESTIKHFKIKKVKRFDNDNNLLNEIAKEINSGKVVGWFQGGCEFGARALGNRSILANPTIDGMKDKINKVIKKREGFRPFAPMVTKEKQNVFFDMKDDIPYMNQVVKVKPEYRDILKATTHVDGTARVQTVYPNSRIHFLLTKFEKLSGYPILLNTSFNVKDKTMVLTPKDAIETFYDTEMDILVLGNYLIHK